jgi:hypothetical protein
LHIEGKVASFDVLHPLSLTPMILYMNNCLNISIALALLSSACHAADTSKPIVLFNDNHALCSIVVAPDES